jgi:hypothetical protein
MPLGVGCSTPPSSLNLVGPGSVIPSAGIPRVASPCGKQWVFQSRTWSIRSQSSHIPHRSVQAASALICKVVRWVVHALAVQLSSRSLGLSSAKPAGVILLGAQQLLVLFHVPCSSPIGWLGSQYARVFCCVCFFPRRARLCASHHSSPAKFKALAEGCQQVSFFQRSNSSVLVHVPVPVPSRPQ